MSNCAKTVSARSGNVGKIRSVFSCAHVEGAVEDKRRRRKEEGFARANE